MKFNQNLKKTRFKMYKAGKNWLVAGIAFFAFAGFGGMAVHADTNQATSANATTEQVQPAANQTTEDKTPDTSEPSEATTTVTSQTDTAEKAVTNTTTETTKDDSKAENKVTPVTEAPKTDEKATADVAKDTSATSDKPVKATDTTAKTTDDNQTPKVADNSDKQATDTAVKTDNQANEQTQTMILAADNQQDGWNADHTQYTRGGQAVTGVQNIDGTYYYFDENHNMVTNNYVQSQWGLSYLFGNDGRIVTGVTQYAGSYYDFDPETYLRVDNNYVQSQWGDWYMFGNDGRIVSGVTPWAGTYYYFDPNTYLRVDNNYVQSQWGNWYMFGNDGRIVTGLTDWNGSKYYFDENTYTKVTNDWRDTAIGHAHFNGDGVLDAVSDTQKAQAVENVASQFSGWGYAWGGNNPSSGFDCSGLTQYAMGQVGVSIPRTAADQYYNSTPISAGQAQKGDLVFFSEGGSIIHTGLYIGNGLMIDAQVAGVGIGVHRVSQLAAYYPAVYGRYLNL
ncbi:NlpC/P60 family protein [Fructilactobacillus frigidiflavus]|uniref:NlpC/P60 family protein n=1 Tax=Fructilactobacillus frigidiflavus TaxID=3242688 RepID=UPI0037569263